MKKILTAALTLALVVCAAVLFQRPDLGRTIRQHLCRTGIFSNRGTWVLAFYLAGDNSLERDQIKNFREICAGSAAVAGTPVVVFLDRDDDTFRDSTLSAWKGSRLFTVTETDYLKVIENPLVVDVPASVDARRFEQSIAGSLHDPKERDFLLRWYEKRGPRYVLKECDLQAREDLRVMLAEKAGYLLPLCGKEYTNLDATDAGTLSRFVHFVQDTFPSDHILLCITGHGNGWFAGESGRPPTAKRHSGEYFRDFEISSLREALKDNPVDVLVLDMCSMGDVETAWELQGCTRYLVSNQTPIPTMGLNYTLLLKRLGQRASLSPEQAACDAAEAYRDTYGDSRQFDLSASALDLGDDFKSFVASFHRTVSDPALLPVIEKAIEGARYVPGRHRKMHPMADLGPLVSALNTARPDPSLSGMRFIIHHAAVNSDLSGVSLYLPMSAESFLKDYAGTSFARDFPHGWASVLPRLYKGGEAASDRPEEGSPD